MFVTPVLENDAIEQIVFKHKVGRKIGSHLFDRTLI